MGPLETPLPSGGPPQGLCGSLPHRKGHLWPFFSCAKRTIFLAPKLTPSPRVWGYPPGWVGRPPTPPTLQRQSRPPFPSAVARSAAEKARDRPAKGKKRRPEPPLHVAYASRVKRRAPPAGPRGGSRPSFCRLCSAVSMGRGEGGSSVQVMVGPSQSGLRQMSCNDACNKTYSSWGLCFASLR